jgi:ketosteroid isomerase-like protein
MTDHEQRLRRLEDERAILRTLYRYGHAIDAGDEQAWLDCFTDDATFSSRGQRESQTTFSITGRAALAEFIAGMSRRPDAFHSHCVIEPLIDVDGDEARVASYLFVLQEHEATPLLRLFGRYDDELVRCADGVWRFRVRAAVVDAMREGLPPLVGGHGTS